MQNEMLKMPIHISSGNKYFSIIKEKIQTYYEELENLIFLPHLSKYKENIEQALKVFNINREKLFKIYQIYFKGNHFEAIKLIKEFVEMNKDELIVPIKHTYAFKYHFSDFQKKRELTELFLVRGRIVEPYEQLKAQEMCHIPLDKRSQVSTSRFSIPGIPALYLSSNTYIVWKELNCPEIDKLTVSYFDLTKLLNKKIINISLLIDCYCDYLSKEDLILQSEIYDNSETIHIINTIKLIPLVIACSVVCDDKAKRDFKEEYVIPQLLMQCLDKECIGIVYNSNRIERILASFTNLVIPIIDFDEDCKYGKILNNIGVSDSLNVGSFKLFISDAISRISINPFAYGPKQYAYKTFYKDMEKGNMTFNSTRFNITNTYVNTIPYNKTLFYLFEEYLLYLNKNEPL